MGKEREQREIDTLKADPLQDIFTYREEEDDWSPGVDAVKMSQAQPITPVGFGCWPTLKGGQMD